MKNAARQICRAPFRATAQCAGGGLHNRFPTPRQPSGTSTHPQRAAANAILRATTSQRRRISLRRHLLQYVTGRATANSMMKLRRFTKRLRYRCGRCFANLNHPHPTREGRACRGRHEDAEGAQRAQCPNSSAPSLQECQMRPASHARRDATREVELPAPPHRRGTSAAPFQPRNTRSVH